MKLLLADDHVLFRDALIQFIKMSKPDWGVTATSDFDAAYNCIEQGNHYDLLLLDLRMPGMDKMYGLQKTTTNYPNQMTAILSGVAHEQDVKKAMAMGARAYLPKTLSGKALVKAIDLVVASGHKFIPMDESGTKIMPAYFDDYPVKEPSGHENILEKKLSSNLTKREREVLIHLSQGLSNKEIAREIGIQIATVKLHVSGVCRKLGVTNRTQAAIMAHNNGLVAETRI